jgi:hypothetical protein
MTLGNMRQLGGLPLVACCLNDACRHAAYRGVKWFTGRKSRRYQRSVHRKQAPARIAINRNLSYDGSVDSIFS